jgi:heme/copper-type cytochrome/quinol oxidase subunit 3
MKATNIKLGQCVSVYGYSSYRTHLCLGRCLSPAFTCSVTLARTLEQWLGLVVTVVLLVSSFFMNRAEVSLSLGDRKGFLRSTLITIILGVTFLVGVVGVEWQLAPFGPSDGAEGAIFYMMTGMHAFHVLTGLFSSCWSTAMDCAVVIQRNVILQWKLQPITGILSMSFGSSSTRRCT